MMSELSKNFTLNIYSVAGSTRDNIRLLLHLADSEEPGDFEKFHSAIFIMHNGIFQLEYCISSWVTALCNGSDGVFYAVSMDGSFFDNRTGKWDKRKLDPYFSFNAIKSIGPNSLFAVGMRGLFLEIHGDNYRRVLTHTDKDIVELAGNATCFIHLIGEQGNIWQFDGYHLNSVASPTNQSLASIAVDNKNTFFICGESGLLMKGANSKWEVIEETEADLFSVTVFQNKPYFAASEEGVLVLEGDNLITFKDNWFADGVATAGGLLFTFSGCDIEVFDGFSWERIQMDLHGLFER